MKNWIECPRYPGTKLLTDGTCRARKARSRQLSRQLINNVKFTQADIVLDMEYCLKTCTAVTTRGDETVENRPFESGRGFRPVVQARKSTRKEVTNGKTQG